MSAHQSKSRTRAQNLERDFSVQLSSSKQLTRLSINGGVLIEGTFGKLQHASFVEAEIFEVMGDCGVLRLNMRKSEVNDIVQECIGGDKK